ncbi:MAG: hypothetical protein LBK82_01870 [Planctomycetaceae bacterium]|nr:hypothetical protein [Planctomycetaceae bacterium]
MIPKRKATQFAVVNLVHSRLTPTRCFSAHLMIAYLCRLFFKIFQLDSFGLFHASLNQGIMN